MGVLDELASYADVEGLPWSTLKAAGAGLLESDEYISLLDVVWERYYRVITTLDITDADWEAVTVDDADEAWASVYREIESRAAGILDAIATAQPMVAYDRATTFYSGVLKRLVMVAAGTSHQAYATHKMGAQRALVEEGKVRIEDAEKSADDIQKTWLGLAKLDEWGILATLKKPQFLSGVGQVPPVAAPPVAVARAIPIVIALVAAIAIVAYLVVAVREQSFRNTFVERQCFDASGNPNPNAPPWCGELGQAIAEDPSSVLATFMRPVTEGVAGLTKTLGWIAGVSAVLYIGGVYVLPALLSAKARKESPA